MTAEQKRIYDRERYIKNREAAGKTVGIPAKNQPKEGSIIKVEPFRREEDIEEILELLEMRNQPRNLCLFLFGINTNLRASDLVRLTVGQVRDLAAGEDFMLREKKTRKGKRQTINDIVQEAKDELLAIMPNATDDTPLFQSRKLHNESQGQMTEASLHRLVKGWARDCGIKGNFGSHSLRKTFGYMHRTVFGTDLPTLMDMFNHSNQRQTLEYLCIQESEKQAAYMKVIGRRKN